MNYSIIEKDNEIHDIAIVGAGPAGSLTAFYLAGYGFNVLLIDKEKFPRNKVCGDAITIRAQKHLRKMGVLDKIVSEGLGNWAGMGGLVSPSGLKYESNSAEELKQSLVISIKRKILDEEMVRAAERRGITLIEEYNVKGAVFNKTSGVWEIFCKDDGMEKYYAKVLVAADGSVSYLSKQLGYIEEPPQAVCSSVYIKANTFDYKGDGMCFYPPELIPGYAAIFREGDGDLVFCCYIIPGGRLTKKDLRKTHQSLLTGNPFIKEALGENAIIEPMKAAPIRFGGIKKSFGDHFLIVGDAAGQIDPLTGEGIQYAMDAAEIAAKVINEGFKNNDLSERFLKKYHTEWIKSFGKDFKYSAKMVKILAKHPILMDAFAGASMRKGPRFMLEWGMIMTGAKPKSHFFKPKLAFPLLLEIIRQKIRIKKIRKN